MLDRLNRDRKNGEDYDVTLFVQGTPVYAHRSILCINSEYFCSMLRGHFKETKEDSIDLTCTFEDVQALQDIVDYCYTGELEINKGNCVELLSAGSHLLLANVVAHCELFLMQNVTEHNCMYFWALAQKHSLLKLDALCKDIGECRFHDLLRLVPETLEVSPQFLESLFQNKNVIQHLRYKDLVRFLVSWTEVESQRKHSLSDILKSVELQSRYPWLSELVNSDLFLVDPVKALKQSDNLDSCEISTTDQDEVREVVVIQVERSGPKSQVAVVYDEKESRWLRMPQHNNANFHVVGVVSGGKKLVLQGTDNTCCVFDIASQTSSVLPSIADYINFGVKSEFQIFCVRDAIYYSVIETSSKPWEDLLCWWKLVRFGVKDAGTFLRSQHAPRKQPVMTNLRLPRRVAGGHRIVTDQFTQQILCGKTSAYVIFQAKYTNEQEEDSYSTLHGDQLKGRVMLEMYEVLPSRKATNVNKLTHEVFGCATSQMDHYQIVAGSGGFFRLSTSRNHPDHFGSPVQIKGVAPFLSKNAADSSMVPVDKVDPYTGGKYESVSYATFACTEGKMFQASFMRRFINYFAVFDATKLEWTTLRPPSIGLDVLPCSRISTLLVPRSFLDKLEDAVYSPDRSSSSLRELTENECQFGCVNFEHRKLHVSHYSARGEVVDTVPTFEIVGV